MLIAHLPAGYCVARCFKNASRFMVPAALIGAVLPDFDMLFFHFVDNGGIHHHRYWVHIPFFWLIVAVISLPLLARTRYLNVGLAFFAGILSHMVLDSIGGGIMWLAPFNNVLYSMVVVPATRSHWILSFIFHWTFGLEILIWLVAIILWRRRTGHRETS